MGTRTTECAHSDSETLSTAYVDTSAVERCERSFFEDITRGWSVRGGCDIIWHWYLFAPCQNTCNVHSIECKILAMRYSS